MRIQSVIERGRKRSHALREVICDDCRMICYTRGRGRIHLCEKCRQIHRAESNRRSEEVQRQRNAQKERVQLIKKRGYRVEADPCDAPLAVGMFIPMEEMAAMLRDHSAVPGMKVSKQRTFYQVVEHGVKLELEVVHG